MRGWGVMLDCGVRDCSKITLCFQEQLFSIGGQGSIRSGFKYYMLNMFIFRVPGRLSDPLVGVHVQLLVGRDRVVPGCAGLGVRQYKICPKI